jgi:ABC-type uncharacterized transport system permease subunit
MVVLASGLAIVSYLGAWALLLHFAFRHQPIQASRVLTIISAGLLAHGVSAWSAVHTAQGFSFGFFNVASVIFWAIGLIVVLSSIRKPLHNLFILLLPFSILAITVGLVFDATKTIHLSPGIFSHILLSILAYAMFTIASFHALLLAWQNRKLKLKQAHQVIGLLPPLQTMETLLFEFVWVGEVLLSLALVTGALYLENMFAQHLSHKIVFSVIAWLIYATLLVGRHRLGWGGMSAIKWTIGGFISLALAYFGSKFVLELLLAP